MREEIDRIEAKSRGCAILAKIMLLPTFTDIQHHNTERGAVVHNHEKHEKTNTVVVGGPQRIRWCACDSRSSSGLTSNNMSRIAIPLLTQARYATPLLSLPRAPGVCAEAKKASTINCCRLKPTVVG